MTVPLIACPQCDLLQRETTPRAGTLAACHRCAAPLYRGVERGLERTLAFTLAAVGLFGIANAFPIAMLDLGNQQTETTLFGAIVSLQTQGMTAVAIVVFITAILAPAIELLLLGYLLIPRRGGRLPRRLPGSLAALELAQSWAMLDVFMLAVLVALSKLAKLATIIPGPALWAYGALVITLAATASMFDRRQLLMRASPQP